MTNLRWLRRVVLVEKDNRVAALWRRLLSMEPSELLELRVPEAGERTTDFLLMCLSASQGVARSRSLIVNPRMRELAPAALRRMAEILPEAQAKIEVIEGDYTLAPDIEATFFVDPPYSDQRARRGYADGCDAQATDYGALAAWCKRRQGQVIVCEHMGAQWLPFERLSSRLAGDRRFHAEAVWYGGIQDRRARLAAQRIAARLA